MLEGVTGYSTFADRHFEERLGAPNKRIFNNAKVSDHFAIIPRGSRQDICPSRSRNFTTW